jgi:hypothetical protein
MKKAHVVPVFTNLGPMRLRSQYKMHNINVVWLYKRSIRSRIGMPEQSILNIFPIHFSAWNELSKMSSGTDLESRGAKKG